jgi:hypothetical protein
MGLWSGIKNVAKKVWRGVKTVARVAVKIVVGVVMRVIHMVGSLLDLIYMVKKKMRIQVFILRESEAQGLVPEQDLDLAISTAKQIFLDRFKVEIRAYGNPIVQTLPDVAPAAALDVHCDWEAWKEEFREAGEYFASKLAGWVGIPISLKFPVSVFVVRSIDGKIGCSIPITDYVTLSATPTSPGGKITGVNNRTTLAHELAHTCLLMHRDDKGNLLYPEFDRGTNVTKWQRWVARTSRHCTWW